MARRKKKKKKSSLPRPARISKGTLKEQARNLSEIAGGGAVAGRVAGAVKKVRRAAQAAKRILPRRGSKAATSAREEGAFRRGIKRRRKAGDIKAVAGAEKFTRKLESRTAVERLKERLKRRKRRGR